MALEALRNVIKHNPGRPKADPFLVGSLKNVALCSFHPPAGRQLVLLTGISIPDELYRLTLCGFFFFVLENRISRCIRVGYEIQALPVFFSEPGLVLTLILACCCQE